MGRSSIIKRVASGILSSLLLISSQTSVRAKAMEKKDEVKIVSPGPIKRGVWNLNDSLAMTVLNKKLKEKSGENTVISAYSLYSALLALREGAKGETKDELSKILSLGPDEDVKGEFKLINEAIEGEDIVVKNAIFAQKDKEVGEDLVKSLLDYYDMPLKKVDFTNKEESEKIINSWIEEVTKGYLKGDSVVTPNTLIKLLNVIYYSGKWEEKFEEKNINFVKRDGEASLVDGLYKEIKGDYIKGENYAAYYEKTEDANVWFILPDEGVKVEDIKDLDKLVGNEVKASEEEIYIHMPLVSIKQSSLSLKEILMEMGLIKIFDKGDLSGFFTDAIVSDLSQTTKLDVDKEGIKAAAKTEITIKATAAPVKKEEKKYLIYNRPYIILIEKNGIPLFTAYVEDPSK